MNPFISIRQGLIQVLSVFMVVASAFSIWKGISLLSATDSPIVVVLTESMEPSFERGDILFLRNVSRPLEVGEVVVFKIEKKDIPIVHRVLSSHYDPVRRSHYYLTKGDNNQADDRGIYAQSERGKLYIYPDEVVGVVYGYLPTVGYITILMNENTKLKIFVLCLLGLITLFTRN